MQTSQNRKGEDMRKYDSKNKTNIFIVIVICVAIFASIALFMKRINSASKKEYLVEANSFLYDADKNMWNLSGTGTIKAKWNGNYYLSYEKEEIKLNPQVVVFNNASRIVNLYGTIYRINEDETVDKLTDETIIEDTIRPKFYKLADRKYLLVASSIKNQRGSFEAYDYLIVELDKMGNATLTNNKVNMKTLKETVLNTSSYSFDIANEILKFGEIKIDLKKIIGSTNLYKPKSTTTRTTMTTTKPINDEPNENGGNGEGGGGQGEGNGDDKPISSITDNRVYQAKNFSVVKNTIGTNYLSIDYSIYDPKSEYKNVFLEIERESDGSVETYYLAKNATSLTIKGLYPNELYKLRYKYSYLDKDFNTLYESFGIDYNIKTLLPETDIVVTKIIKDVVYFTVSASDRLMYGAKANLYINGQSEALKTQTFESENATDRFSATFDISDLGNVDYFEIKVPSITYATGETKTDLTIRVKN